jgi:RNA polymerase sigma factor (sigma-70 family)
MSPRPFVCESGVREVLVQNSKQAFLTSVERQHGRQLRRYLAARLRNAAADAPDLMQEIFLRLLRLEDHESIRNPQAYLYTIAGHVLQQHALKQAKDPQLAATAEMAFEFSPVAEADPATEVATEQAFEVIERTLQAISPRAHLTLVLSRGHGMQLQEIAQRLGVSRAQVKKYLAKALIHVRNHLREINEEQQ